MKRISPLKQAAEKKSWNIPVYPRNFRKCPKRKRQRFERHIRRGDDWSMIRLHPQIMEAAAKTVEHTRRHYHQLARNMVNRLQPADRQKLIDTLKRNVGSS